MTLREQSRDVLGTQFAQVDSSDDPEARVRYLDVVTAMALQYKQDSYAALALRPGAKVLDAGCGTGDDAREIAEIVGSNGIVIGLDASATMIERARERSAGSDLPIEFVQGSIYEMEFPDDAFDASRADRVFQHLDDSGGALREMIRVTRPGGRVSVVDPDWGTELVDTDNRDLFRRIHEFRERQRLQQPGDGWRGRQLLSFFTQAGLRDILFDPGVWYTTSLDIANQVVDVLDWAREAHEAGAVTPDEVEIWEREMRERDAEFRFLVALTGFTVTGTVPG